MNRFNQVIALVAYSILCNLYAQSDQLDSSIISGPIRYVLPENVTKNHSSDVLSSELFFVLNDLTVYDSNDEPFSQFINLVVLDASPLEIYNPLINQTAESNPFLIPYLYDPDEPIIFTDIISSIGQNKPWHLPQDWLRFANERYKQIDELTLKSGQKAYVFEKTDFFEGEAFQMYHIVSKLEEGSMSRLLHLHIDERGLGKALELAKSLEYSKTGFEQEDSSIENQAVSTIDDLISTPVELDEYQEDGPFSVQFAKDRKFKILHPYAEVGPNVYGAYKTEMVTQGSWKATSYRIFAHYVKTASKDGASMITEDFDKYFQKKGGERFKTSKMKDGFLIRENKYERFEIHLDLSDPDWKEKFTDSDHQPWLHLSVEGPEQDLDHALSVVNSANFSSAINPQKIVLSDFLSETTSPTPVQEIVLDQEFPPSPENVELENEEQYELLRTTYREYDKLMIPTTWNWLDVYYSPLNIPIFSDTVLMQESPFTDDAVNYSKLLYSNLEQRASYQAWVVQNENDIPPTDMVVEKFKTESGFCGVSIHSESMNYYYILLDVTTEERRNDRPSLGNYNPESVWLLWEFPTIFDKEEFEIYRAIVNTYQNRKSQQALPCPPSEESETVHEVMESNDQSGNDDDYLSGVSPEYITTEEFLSGITNEDLAGPIVGNKYFQFEVPSGFDFLNGNLNSEVSKHTIITTYYKQPYSFTLTVSVFNPKNGIESQTNDPQELLNIRFQEDNEHLRDVFWNVSDPEWITSENGYLGISWSTDNAQINALSTVPLSSVTELIPEPSYSIIPSYESDPLEDEQVENWLIVTIEGNLTPMSVIKQVADSFILKDSAQSASNPSSNDIENNYKNTNSSQKTKKITENFELTSLSYNWYESDWLGTFFESDNGNWTYHVDMDWIYPVAGEGSPESAWIWKEDAGWLWTSESAYPYLYSDTTKFWIKLGTNQEEANRYFDYFDEKWRRWGEFPSRTTREIEAKSVNRILQSTQTGSTKADQIRKIIYLGL